MSMERNQDTYKKERMLRKTTQSIIHKLDIEL